jgi:hypothetical protein
LAHRQGETVTRDELLAIIDQAAREDWTELDLLDQEISELPPEIGRLTSLEKLSIGCREWRRPDGRTNSSGQVSWDVSPGSGTIYVDGKKVYEGQLSGTATVYK